MTAGQRIQVKFTPNNTNVITLRASSPNRLDRLTDVTPDTSTTANNSTLVYNPETDKYVVKLLDLDGGEF
jgi:hypothetical protein